MKRIFGILSLMLISFIGLQSCSSDDPVGPGNPDIPPIVGCEAATTYDWDAIEFETSLNGGADTWLAFSLEELTLFTVVINQAGFQCTVYNGCEGEVGLDPPLFQFETVGNGYEIGIVPEGEYWVNILNTRPNRMDFTFRIELADIVYGCMNDDAINYNELANVEDGSCEFQNCNTEYYLENYGEMILDCDGNCSPTDWVGDGWCDDGAWAIYDEEGNQVPINLYCAELNWDDGDCEVIDEGCSPGLIEDCNGICGPEGWLGDGFCDDGSYDFNGDYIFFNCEEFNNDEGDCDVLQRGTQKRELPNGRIKVQ